MGEGLAFDHVHLISRDPRAAAKWNCEMFGGEIPAATHNDQENNWSRPVGRKLRLP